MSNIQFFADDRIFSSQDVSIFQEVMGDITAEEMKVPEEQFLNVEVINEADMNVIKSLVENGESVFILKCIYKKICFRRYATSVVWVNT